MRYLDANAHLMSDFWFDQPNALDMVDQRAEQTAVDAQLLHDFVEKGYMIVKATDEMEELAAQVSDDVDRAWAEMSGVATYSAMAKRRTMLAGLDPERHRSPGYRISDIHGFSESALELALNSSVFRYINALFGEPAVAFQTLYFEWGSQQTLHRDPMFVRTNPPSALLASWLALEDIHDDAGPLMYVPGSHRYPWYEFVKGDVKMDKGRNTNADRAAFEKKYRADMEKNGHSVEYLTCNKGDALIWHGSLLHGGSPHENFGRTRKSIVTHYSLASAMTSVANSIYAKSPTAHLPEQVLWKSENVIQKGDARIFEAPLHERNLTALVEKGYASTPDY